MISLRSIVFSFFTALLVSFALPASAVDKNYSLNVSPTVAAGASTATITAAFTNATPNGNSSINSLRLGVSGGGLSIIGASVPNGTISPVPSAAFPRQTINVTNMSPLKPNKTFTVTLTVKTDPASGCAATSAQWSSTTWTGSSLSGENFAFQSGSSNVVTNVTTACSLVFVRQPQSAFSGGAVGGPVTVQGSPASAFVGSTVTLTTTSGSPAITGNTGIVSGAGVAVFPNLSITGAGTYSLLASTGIAGYPTAQSSSFVVANSDGVLSCSQALNPAFTMPSGVVPITETGYAAGSRGAHNKDGSTCIPVNYDFTNDIATSNSARLRWDTTSQPGAAFIYTVTWQDEFPDLSAGVPTRRTKVAWQFDPITGEPIVKVYGVACVGSSLPAPYGTLTVGIDNAQTTISVTMPGTPPAVPFPAAIGSERIQVTAVVGSNWTVVRGAGNAGADAAAHTGGTPVMSTPLPIDPNPYLPGTTTPNPYQGKQAQVCIADEGWVSVGGGKVRFTTTVFDVGDGFINRDL